MIIKQAGTGDSDEGIRINVGNTFTIRNSIVWSDAASNQQDAIFTDKDATVNIENCFCFGFGRSAVQKQQVGAAATININSCGFFDCGSVDSAGQEGGIVHDNGTSTVYNVHNNWVIDCDAFGDDYIELNAATWNISFSIDSDNSIATVRDTGSGNLASRVINESTGGGDEIIVVDKTSLPYDLTLVDDGSNNDAQDAHTTDTVHGITIPSTDIRAGTRPLNTNHDIGPFEITPALSGALFDAVMRGAGRGVMRGVG